MAKDTTSNVGSNDRRAATLVDRDLAAAMPHEAARYVDVVVPVVR